MIEACFYVYESELSKANVIEVKGKDDDDCWEQVEEMFPDAFQIDLKATVEVSE